MRARRVVVSAVVTALLFLPAMAVGQAPAPVSKLSLVDFPPGPTQVSAGAQHRIPVKIALSLDDVACAQDVKLTLAVQIMDLPSPLQGVMAHPAQATLNVTLPAGAYSSSGPNGAFTKTFDDDLLIMLGADAPDGHDHEFMFTVTFPGGTPQGCIATSDLPKAQAQASHKIHINGGTPASSGAMAGMDHSKVASPVPGTTTVAPSTSQGQAQVKQTPGPSIGALLVALVALALLVGRARVR